MAGEGKGSSGKGRREKVMGQTYGLSYQKERVYNNAVYSLLEDIFFPCVNSKTMGILELFPQNEFRGLRERPRLSLCEVFWFFVLQTGFLRLSNSNCLISADRSEFIYSLPLYITECRKSKTGTAERIIN